MTTDPATAGVRLRPPHHRVERRAITWWTLRALVHGVLLLGPAIAAYVIFEPARPWLVVPLALLALWTLVKMAVQPWVRYAVHRWESTEHAVYGLAGWIVREWRVAPVSRIQTVDAVRGPLEQMLNLSTLRVTTASAQGAIKIVGLDREVAAEWADRLTAIVERTEGDAT